MDVMKPGERVVYVSTKKMLWLNDTSNPNTFMQTLRDDEKI